MDSDACQMCGSHACHDWKQRAEQAEARVKYLEKMCEQNCCHLQDENDELHSKLEQAEARVRELEAELVGLGQENKATAWENKQAAAWIMQTQRWWRAAKKAMHRMRAKGVVEGYRARELSPSELRAWVMGIRGVAFVEYGK